MTEAAKIKSLYNERIMELAENIPLDGRMEHPDATASVRSPLCGSRITVDLMIKDGMIADYHARGFQIATHAIGDAAIEQVLSGYERAMGNTVDTQRRHRIEHCGFLTQDQLDRMARIGVLPAPQPIFLYEFGDLYVDALGHGRPEASYPMRRWQDAGLHPSGSSDGPVSSTNPFRGLYTMVTRRTNSGTVLGADEALTLEEAIGAYTVNSAYGSFEEGIKGTLAPGMLADVAVLDTDLFATEPSAWLDAQADLTIVGGTVAHDRLGQF